MIVFTATVVGVILGVQPAVANTYNINCPDTPYAYRYETYSNGATRDRFELRDGDRAPGDVINHPNDRRQRCEVVEQTRPAMGTQMWLSFGFRWSGANPSTRDVLVQYHQPPDPTETAMGGKRPGFTLISEGGQLRVYTRADNAPTSTTDAPEVLRYSQPFFAPNVWYNVLLRVKYGPDGSGGY